MRSLAVFGALFLLAGCSSNGNGGGSSNPRTVTIEMEPWQVMPGEDRIWCKTMKVPSDVTLDVSKFTVTMPDGSHHFILYTSDTDYPDGFGGCQGMNDRMFITGSQISGVYESAYGPGLALPLFAGQQLILESHYANASGDPITAHVSVEMEVIDHADVADYVQTILIPHTSFSIPPQTTGYTSSMTVPEMPGFNVISATSHAHARLTKFTADRVTPAGTNRIFETTDWDSPQVERYTPPLAGDSANSITFECTWNNETTGYIEHGSTQNDEMCILVLTFFPAYSWSP